MAGHVAVPFSPKPQMAAEREKGMNTRTLLNPRILVLVLAALALLVAALAMFAPRSANHAATHFHNAPLALKENSTHYHS